MAESRDSMVKLNNHLQSRSDKPEVKWEFKAHGPGNATKHTATLFVDGKAIALGQAYTKRAAKAEAARNYLTQVQESKDDLSGANS